MVTGNKTVHKSVHSQGPFPWLGLIVCVAITALTVYLIIEVWPPEPVEDYFGY